MGRLARVLIMAGGTGGHVFPGLAIAARLRREGIEVSWLGTRKGLESRLVPAENIPIHYISITGLRGKGWGSMLLAPYQLTKAIFQAFRILRKVQPDLVIGMGGFVSGPGGIASWLLRLPLVIHEQNAKPGTTNKWLAKVAKKVLEGFPNTFSEKSRAIFVGNPVRTEIATLANPTIRFNVQRTGLRLLIVGGSLGAQAINDLVPAVLAKIPASERPEVLHQTGEKHFLNTQAVYAKLQVRADVRPFITDMAKAYDWADFVICRAGALTIAELCAVGLGAILIPFPYAVDDHQTANASFMVKNKSAFLLPQAELTAERLLELLKDFVISREKCYLLAQSAYESRKIDATEHMYRICEETL